MRPIVPRVTPVGIYFMGGRQKVFTDKEMKQMNIEAGIYEKVL